MVKGSSLMVIFVFCALLVVGEVSAQEHTYVVFEDDFEDGDVSEFVTWKDSPDAGFEVISEDGNNIVHMTGSVLLSPQKSWADHTISGRFKVAKGKAALFLRESGNGAYEFHMESNMIDLGADVYNIGRVLLGRKTVSVGQNKWHDFKVVAIGNNIKFYMDDKIVIDAIDDDNTFQSGSFGIKSKANCEIYFDDLKVLTEPPQTGSISVTSNPSGANVALRSRSDHNYLTKGTSPITIDDLDEGGYYIKVSKEGYRDVTKSVDVSGNEVSNVDVTLELVEEVVTVAEVVPVDKYTHLAFEDDFEDGDFKGWDPFLENEYSGWEIITENGNKIAYGTGKAGLNLRPRDWEDFNFSGKFKIMGGDGKAGLWVRTSHNAGGYSIKFRSSHIQVDATSSGGATNTRLFTKSGTFLFSQNSWHEFNVVVEGNNLKFYLDGKLIIDIGDENNFFQSGTIGLICEDKEVYFDDIKVLTEPPAEETPTVVEESPTAAIISKAEKLSESVGKTVTREGEDKGNTNVGIIIGTGLLALFVVVVAFYKTRRKKGPDKPPSSPLLKPPSTSKSLPVEFEGTYTDVEYLGEGGFAWAFSATRADGEKVALKIPKSNDPETRKSFTREVSNWSNLDHENIVKLLDFDIYPMPFIEMEFCESDFVYKLPSIERTVSMICDIARGLKHAHERRIIHGDLKPSNLLLKDGKVKISDWGLSKMKVDRSVSIAGITPQYAAPEQISSKFGKSDERTDIYQLGIIFYGLATGKSAFSGELSEIYDAVLHNAPDPPSMLNPAVKPFEGVLMRCLEKRKEERYQNMDELLGDLEALMKEYLKDKDESGTEDAEV